MSSSDCSICKVHEKNNNKLDSNKTNEELTAKSETENNSDNEIYETESEHDWDSDDPDNLIESTKKMSTSHGLKAKSGQNDLEDNVSEKKKVEDHNVSAENNLKDNSIEKNKENTNIRVTRGLPRTNKVKMPSGNEVYITKPNTHGWKCGRKTKLITLHKNGRRGKKEYGMVVDEMEKTKLDIPNCANRGGCLKSYKVLKIRKIVNGCLWDRYQDRKHDIAIDGPANERMLFHGTKNIWEIVGHGFDERFSNPNGIFGAGVYFAEKSSAANEYTFGILGGTGCPLHNNKSCTSCIRRMMLCRVTLGKTHDNGASGTKYAHAPVGFHSVIGKNGPTNYTEFIIYRGEQAYPEYLISYTINV